ncbi:MAG: SH3 domain-containing protein [Pseudomonadota bacterium]
MHQAARTAAFVVSSVMAVGLMSSITITPASAREVACATGAELKSENGDAKAIITFTNRTTDKQTIYWIDYDGKRQKYQELNAGESYDQPTFLTHPWLVTGLRDKCVGYYFAEGKRTSVEPGLAPKIMPRKTRKIAKAEGVDDSGTAAAAPGIAPSSSSSTSSSAASSEPSDRDASRRSGEAAEIDDDVDAFDTPASRDDRDATGGDDRAFARRDDRDRIDDDVDAFDDDADVTIDRDTGDDTRRADDAGAERDDDSFETAEVQPRVRSRAPRTPRISPEWGDDLDEPSGTPLARDWRCSGYLSRTRSVICRDPELRRLDADIRQAMRDLMRELPRRQRVRLRTRQERWEDRREACDGRPACVRERTRRRLARLNERRERTIARRSAARDGRDGRGGLGFDGDRPGRRITLCGEGFVDDGRGRCRRAPRSASLGARFPVGGSSLGGNVRDVPGLDGRRVATLREGDRVRIIEGTGERYQGYEWFRIRFNGGAGYQWGGILCADRRVTGIFEVCR